jgi:preprotein translocase subunit SecG
MENIVLTIHLILALLLIGIVLMQRSEGGIGMGGGGGGGGGGAMSGRAAATALTKATWIVAVGFLTTSITLTVISAASNRDESVVTAGEPVENTVAPLDIPLAPLGADAPSAPPPAE